MYIQNLHTHTFYCDGADSPEEIILCAIKKGFSSIGFSGHSFNPYSEFFAKRGDKTAEYRENVLMLKEKYKDRLDVFLGLEVEDCSPVDRSGYDYLIGGVHYLNVGDTYKLFDSNPERFRNMINEHFGGDGMRFAKAYYTAVSELPSKGDFDIIAHFDLITKHIEKESFFDITSKEYKTAAYEAIDALKGEIPFFEVNTGGIARGYRKMPYPMPDIIKEFKRQGFGVVITSDCHDKNMIDCKFDEAAELLKECGYKEKYILTKDGFFGVAI
ncbi:MAG: histidinol-phosphatase HisJ family protein [Ruminococcaceae bacterium]|nr:histidinol-phosphatase HisJ family protein [Oscillospiraceae bacterium]